MPPRIDTTPTLRTARFSPAQYLRRLRHGLADTVAIVGVVAVASVVFAVNAAIADPVQVSNLGGFNSLNLRTAPTTQAQVITQMPRGARNLDWTGNQVRNGSTLWYEVSYQGRVGWAAARYLTPITTTQSYTVNGGAGDYYPAPGSAPVYASPQDYLADTQVYAPSHAPAYATTTPPGAGYTTSVSGSGSAGITGEHVGAALFGLVVGGILVSALGGDDDHGGGASGGGSVHQPDPHPQPPRGNRGRIQCSGSNATFSHHPASGNVRLTINGREVSGMASAPARAGRGNFALPFTTPRGDGTLIVDDIRSGGQNASLHWEGRRNGGLYRMHCAREGR